MVILKSSIANKLCPILSAKVLTQSREPVPVIVQLNNTIKNINNYVSSLSADISFSLPIINGFAGLMSTETIYKLSTSQDVAFISFDNKVHTLLDIALPTIAADFAHEKGYKGENITIAIIDTGVFPHDDLIKPINRIIAFEDVVNKRDKAYDDNGHGTHVAGIIAGNGYSSNGKYAGVAPSANLLIVKALDENGGGSSSDIIHALSFIIETKDLYNTKIVNLSLGSPARGSCAKDPLCKAVEKTVDAGLIVMVAAGNSGPKEGSILSPGISSKVITVGAIDDKNTIDFSDDTLADFSSRGPTLDGLNKPDILAPGVNIESLSNSNTSKYISLSGTSMATPMVSGSVALLLNKYGNLTAVEVKEKLINSCVPLSNNQDKQSAGILNLKKLFEESQDGPIDNGENNNNIFNKDEMMELIFSYLFG